MSESFKIEMKGMNTLVCNDFSAAYPELNKEIYLNGARQDSRNGMTGEVLNFKTVIKKPIDRCVGGYNRNVNIFFLIAEALWIFKGERDVEFLDIFNSQMKNYSDDGINFHAPYGWRLRNWGMQSDDITSVNVKRNNYKDQIESVLNLLEEDSETRRAVASIWNPDFDIDVVSKDLPCNDLLMWKIREGKLHTTIANRSNDLHWGLTTNIFQFSFISEIMAKILGVKVGTQTHLSQSLHIYMDLPVCKDMINQMDEPYNNIYANFKSSEMDFNFGGTITASSRLAMIDTHIEAIIHRIKRISKGEPIENEEDFLRILNNFSDSLFNMYAILKLYAMYKVGVVMDGVDIARKNTINKLILMSAASKKHQDFYALAINFFVQRMDEEDLEGLVIPENARAL